MVRLSPYIRNQSLDPDDACVLCFQVAFCEECEGERERHVKSSFCKALNQLAMHRDAEADNDIWGYFSFQNLAVALRFALSRYPLYEGADDPFFRTCWQDGQGRKVLLTHAETWSKGESLVWLI